ncbi:hypothetical protein HYT01_00705 [Candidatus Giovannonibacteria bacterium]|nr:hypothetical protein [Candidatus Giovannonibacteria bacterium]
MISYASEFVSLEEMKTYLQIKKIVEAMPGLHLGKDDDGKDIVLSCHILARAIARVFGLDFVDGHFLTAYEHSWVTLPSGKIIDVYPVAAVGGPIMYDRHFLSPAHRLYKKQLKRGRRVVKDAEETWFKEAVEKTTQEIFSLGKVSGRMSR